MPITVRNLRTQGDLAPPVSADTRNEVMAILIHLPWIKR